jgi:hypothetical protein
MPIVGRGCVVLFARHQFRHSGHIPLPRPHPRPCSFPDQSAFSPFFRIYKRPKGFYPAMSYRNDSSAGYDRTLLSSVPDPTRAEKQVRANPPALRINSKAERSPSSSPYLFLSTSPSPPLTPLSRARSRFLGRPPYLLLLLQSYRPRRSILVTNRKGTTSTCWMKAATAACRRHQTTCQHRTTMGVPRWPTALVRWATPARKKPPR